ncbi:Crinkler (CRN) family protein [Phytophthora palmivora]|uniref:Crinkler (CRN) family protein n=1 Tax=Phytophthora palmivora TaxID=4796 RepID=A0A2P4XX24_9STRA|nr:Crinkler (CRN) family protein [Phytophthora palmivora]
MVKLFCAIVGAAGSAFSVRVDESDTVDDLKGKIKEKKPNDLKNVDAKNLQLFLAKTAEGAWLDGAGVAAVKLSEDGTLRGFEPMDPLKWIKNRAHFREKFRPVNLL